MIKSIEKSLSRDVKDIGAQVLAHPNSKRSLVGDDGYKKFIEKVTEVCSLVKEGYFYPSIAYDVILELADCILDERIGLNEYDRNKKAESFKKTHEVPMFEFVSYNGEFPDYCTGKLVFTYHGRKKTCEGGCKRWVGPDYGMYTEWGILWDNVEHEFTEDERVLFEKMVRDNIEFRCCGGCA